MPVQQLHPSRASKLAAGVGTVDFVHQTGMGLRQRRQARRAGDEGLPARALHGKDQRAQGGLDAVAMLAQYWLLRRGVVANGCKSMHANGSTTGLDKRDAATAASSPAQSGCACATTLCRVKRMIGGGDNEGGYKLVMCSLATLAQQPQAQAQARRRILDIQAAPMQGRDGRHDGQAQAIAGQMAALVEPVKTLRQLR